MAIDDALTSAKAIAAVGEIALVKPRWYLLRDELMAAMEERYAKIRAGEPLGIEPDLSPKDWTWEQFPIDDPNLEDLPKGILPDLEQAINYDLTWRFSASDQIVVARQRWIDAQRTHGMYSKEAIEANYSWVGTFYRTNIPAIIRTYAEDTETAEERRLDTEARFALADLLSEALTNAIEHGSEFGQQGDVSVRMIGGYKGIAFFVDDPGKHDFKVEPVGEDYKAKWNERSNAELKKEYAKSYPSRPYVATVGSGLLRRPPGARGLGKYRYTVDEHCLVNSERLETGEHRLILLSQFN